MAVTPTLPTPGGDFGVWGDKLNTAAGLIATEINTHESANDPHADRAYADTNKLDKAQNLADVASPTAARTALGLGSAATSNTGDFATPASVADAVAAAIAANRLVNL